MADGGSSGGWSRTGITAALVYAVCSLTIVLTNKAVQSVYGFKYPVALTLAQGMFTLCGLLYIRTRGFEVRKLEWSVAKRVAPLSMVFLLYVVVSLKSTDQLSVPMFTALRRTTIVAVIVLEKAFLGTVPSRPILACVGVMLLGAVIAASYDLSFNLVAYLMIVVTNIATAGYQVAVSGVKRETQLNVFSLLYYNTVLTLPVLLLLVFLTGEYEDVLTFVQGPYWGDFGFFAVLAGSCTLAFFMNIAMYYSTSLNGPTTQTVVGNMKNFVAFILGLIMFSDYKFQPTNFAGLCIGFLGGVSYAVIKSTQGRRRKRDTNASATAAAVTDSFRDDEQGSGRAEEEATGEDAALLRR